MELRTLRRAFERTERKAQSSSSTVQKRDVDMATRDSREYHQAKTKEE